MTVNDPKTLARVGVADKALSGGVNQFEVEDDKKYRRGYMWFSEAECTSKGIQLRPKVADEEISALVYPPVGLDEDHLNQYLIDNNVDVSNWGQGTAKSVADFSEELVKGESTLHRQESGRIVRLVDIVVLKLVKAGVGQEFILREIEENVGDRVMRLDRLSATKRRADEHPFSAARRLISKYLHIDENAVNIDPDDVRIVEEEQESTSYPGLVSVYRKRFMTANMRFLPTDAGGVGARAT